MYYVEGYNFYDSEPSFGKIDEDIQRTQLFHAEERSFLKLDIKGNRKKPHKKLRLKKIDYKVYYISPPDLVNLIILASENYGAPYCPFHENEKQRIHFLYRNLGNKNQIPDYLRIIKDIASEEGLQYDS